MLEKLMQNPYAWALLSICSIVSFVFAIYTWFKGKEKKEFSYSLVSNAIIRGGERQDTALKVTYNGIEIKDLTSTKIAIWNSGNKVLNKSDMVTEKELTVSVSEGKEILALEIVAQSDETNQFLLTKPTDNAQSISFDYVDVNEGAVVQVFHTGFNDDITVEGKIKGGRPIRLIKPTKHAYPKRLEANWAKVSAVYFLSFFLFTILYLLFMLATMWSPSTLEWFKIQNDLDRLASMGVGEKVCFSALCIFGIGIAIPEGINVMKKAFFFSVPSKLRKYM